MAEEIPCSSDGTPHNTHSSIYVGARLRSEEKRHGPFLIRGEGLGNFGRRVLFVNVELSPELRSFQQDLAEILAEHGIPREKRPYHPHITLATRLRSNDFNKYQRQPEGY